MLINYVNMCENAPLEAEIIVEVTDIQDLFFVERLGCLNEGSGFDCRSEGAEAYRDTRNATHFPQIKN